MKLKFSIIAVALVSMASVFTSCESKTKLAKQIEGSWTATPERLSDDNVVSATAVRIFDFLPDTSTPVTNGQLVMSSMITITNAATNPGDSIMQHYEMTATGVATVTGSWTAIDDDEVMVNVDPSTLNVRVDPEGVEINVNAITGQTVSVPDSLKPAFAESIRAQIRVLVEKQFFGFSKIDDISIKDDFMKMEINHHDYSLRRQN